MAAITQKDAPLGVTTTLETRAITNQSGTATHRGYVQVPHRAKGATFFLNVASVGGTTPLVDFAVQGVNPATLDDGDLTPIANVTQLTAAGQAHLVIDSTEMPRPHMAYVVTLDGTTADEDYTYQLYITWHEEA